MLYPIQTSKPHFNGFYQWIAAIIQGAQSLAAGKVPEQVSAEEQRLTETVSGYAGVFGLVGTIGSAAGGAITRYKVNEELIKYAKKIARNAQVQAFFENHANLVTIILTGLLTPEAVPKVAMGYKGADPQFPGYYPVNQKNLLADHCAMKIPDKELMDKIYIGQLMARQVQSFKFFGKYPVG